MATSGAPGEVPDFRRGRPLLRQPALGDGDSDLQRPSALTWPPSGTPPKTGTSPPGTWWPAAAGRSGGNAPRGMNGRRSSPPGPTTGPAARYAPEKRWHLGRTTWPPSAPTWPGNGTKKGTEPSRRTRSPLTATGRSGGGAGWGTAGKPLSAPGLGEATAPTAPGGRPSGVSNLATRAPWWPRSGPRVQQEPHPQMVTVGSHKKVWWRRCAQGHVWKGRDVLPHGAQALRLPGVRREGAAARRGHDIFPHSEGLKPEKKRRNHNETITKENAEHSSRISYGFFVDACDCVCSSRTARRE